MRKKLFGIFLIVMLTVSVIGVVYGHDDIGFNGKLAGGALHSLALKSDGTLWAWGKQLGDGTNIEKLVPTQIMADVKFVEAGDMHSFAIKTDDTLWAWGKNTECRLGIGELYYGDYDPTLVMSEVKLVTARSGHSAAIKKDGTLWVWGANSHGQLGNGSKQDKKKTVYGVLPEKIKFNYFGQ